jgi:hypothetical protein
MAFIIDGTQFFGILSLTNNGSTLVASIFTIYNNCPTDFAGGYVVSSPSTFPIQSTDPLFNFNDYHYSITFTPQNLIQTNQLTPLIPYYLNQTLVTENIIQVNMSDYLGDDFSPDGTSDDIIYFINIRLT